MNAAYVKQMAQTGDVLLVRGTSSEQRAIQLACPPFCHVAQLVRLPTALMVVEILEPNGYQSMTFEDWMQVRSGDEVFFGQAPDQVRKGGQAILNRQAVYQAHKDREYDFSALPLVWLSQVTGKTYVEGGEVCSLLIRDDWEAAGYKVPGDPSPGSFLALCESISPVRK